MLRLPIHDAVRFVLVRPHYPENVGATARAIKTMGFTQLTLVKPGRLAVPEHEMAYKMAVKAWDVLRTAQRFDTVDAALQDLAVGPEIDSDLVVATTSHKGIVPRVLAAEMVERARRGRRIAILFGNEKTGLSPEDASRAIAQMSIPMAAEQPSINLAQASQIVAYELFCNALALQGPGAVP